MLSMHNKPFILKSAIENGAMGYVLKDSEPEVIEAAIHAVCSSKQYLDVITSYSIHYTKLYDLFLKYISPATLDITDEMNIAPIYK